MGFSEADGLAAEAWAGFDREVNSVMQDDPDVAAAFEPMVEYLRGAHRDGFLRGYLAGQQAALDQLTARK